MEQGNFSNAKGVGEGVLEYKIDFGLGLSRVLRAGRRHDRHLAHGRYEEAAATGYRCGKAYWRDYKLSQRGRR